MAKNKVIHRPKCRINKGLLKKSRGKIKKLSTGVQEITPSSEKIAPHIYEERKQDKELKKEKRKKEFPALKAGKGPTPETTQKSPNLYLGVANVRLRDSAGVGLAFRGNARQKIHLLPKIFPKLQNKISTLLWKG